MKTLFQNVSPVRIDHTTIKSKDFPSSNKTHNALSFSVPEGLLLLFRNFRTKIVVVKLEKEKQVKLLKKGA